MKNYYKTLNISESMKRFTIFSGDNQKVQIWASYTVVLSTNAPAQKHTNKKKTTYI